MLSYSQQLPGLVGSEDDGTGGSCAARASKLSDAALEGVLPADAGGWR
jgi:hypothetical protein